MKKHLNHRAVAVLATAALFLLAWATGQELGTSLLAGLPFFIGVADAEMIIRSSVQGALTADETTAALDIGPFPLDGVPFRLTIPTDGSGTLTLAVILKSSTTSGGTYVEESRFSVEETTDGVTLTFTAAGIYRKRLTCSRQFVKFTFDVTGAANFGNVDLRAESAGVYDNARRDL